MIFELVFSAPPLSRCAGTGTENTRRNGLVCEDAPEGEHNLALLNQPTFIARDAEDMQVFTQKMVDVKELTPFNIAPPPLIMNLCCKGKWLNLCFGQLSNESGDKRFRQTSSAPPNIMHELKKT